MPYYTFHDREQSRPEIAGNWKAQLVAFFRKREKEPRKTDTPGLALQSAAGQFMAGHRMPEKFRPLVIDALKRYFRLQEHITDPSKPMIAPRRPVGQMELTFESIFRNALLSEDGDQVIIGDDRYYDNLSPDAHPFIFSKDGREYIAGASRGFRSHLDLIDAEVERIRGVEHDSSEIIKTQYDRNGVFIKTLIELSDEGDYMPIYSKFTSGRVWDQGKVLGFWNKPEEVSIIFPEVLKLYPAIKDDWVLDFTATNRDLQMTVAEFMRGGKQSQERSREEKEALIRQHLEPQFKKQLKATPGSEVNARVASKAGYNTPAKFNATRIVGDSVEHA
jgi:hypothetical protein